MQVPTFEKSAHNLLQQRMLFATIIAIRMENMLAK